MGHRDSLSQLILSCRMQLTRVGTSLSDQLTVNYGVPQGSILRPAMLSLHMYDLPNAVQFSSVESYVDDTKIFLSFSSKDVDLSLERSSEDLCHAAKQCCSNQLLINPGKTKLIVFRTRQRDMSVPFFGQALVPVSSVKYLGIVLNSHLTFNEHFTCLTSSLLSTLCQISGVTHLFSRPVLILNSLVLTKLFCSTFLGWYHQAKPTKAATGVKLCCSSCD